MKIVLKIANDMRLIVLMYVVSLACSSVLFSFFEGKSLWDGLWWSAVTALTIGYGDLSPVTVPGRITGILFGHFWIFGVIPMIIGNVVSRMLEDKNKFTNDEQEWHEETLKAIAEKVGVAPKEPPPDY